MEDKDGDRNERVKVHPEGNGGEDAEENPGSDLIGSARPHVKEQREREEEEHRGVCPGFL
jgi:hypothetical protein